MVQVTAQNFFFSTHLIRILLADCSIWTNNTGSVVLNPLSNILKENMMKHKMTTFLATALALALVPAGQLQAQPDKRKHHRSPGAEMRVAHLTRALELSDEQSAQLLEVFQAVDQERMALRQQVAQQMKPQFCELKQATEEEISRILDDDQLARLEEIKSERQTDRPRGGWREDHDLDCSDGAADSS
jgi:hypothetical protein